MYSYRVKYAWSNDAAAPDEPRHGFGKVDVETDEPVDTPEQLAEIPRALGVKNGYTSCAVVDLQLRVGDKGIDLESLCTPSEDEPTIETSGNI